MHVGIGTPIQLRDTKMESVSISPARIFLTSPINKKHNALHKTLPRPAPQ